MLEKEKEVTSSQTTLGLNENSFSSETNLVRQMHLYPEPFDANKDIENHSERLEEFVEHFNEWPMRKTRPAKQAA